MRCVALAALSISITMPVTAVPPPTFGISTAKTYVVSLSGDAEVNKKLAGDTDGSGLVELTVDPGGSRICYEFTLSGVAMPLMAHIHRGAEQSVGPSVVTLFTGPGGELHDCLMWTEKRLAEIVANPSNFYVNLYTTEYPDGALRGQLSG